MKMTYAEKLRDPRWQRKRLERLEKASWCCDCCGASDNTLHVHHNDYFKGREPWEYELAQLTVLCEDCHTVEHESEDYLLLAASRIGTSNTPHGRDSAASLLAGFCFQDMGDTPDPEMYLYGELITRMSKGARVRALNCLEIESLIAAISSDGVGFNDALRAFAGLAYAEPQRFTG